MWWSDGLSILGKTLSALLSQRVELLLLHVTGKGWLSGGCEGSVTRNRHKWPFILWFELKRTIFAIFWDHFTNSCFHSPIMASTQVYLTRDGERKMPAKVNCFSCISFFSQLLNFNFQSSNKSLTTMAMAMALALAISIAIAIAITITIGIY